jgi:hypothetical protein
MIKFIYERDEHMENHCHSPKIEVTCDAETITGVVEVFKGFLLSVGYSEELIKEVINEDD